MELSGRLPGAMALAGPLDEAVDVGDAELGGEVVHLVVEEKAREPAVTREPKESLRVVVTATAFPSPSTTEKWVVLWIPGVAGRRFRAQVARKPRDGRDRRWGLPRRG